MSARAFGAVIVVLGVIGLLGYGLVSKGEATISTGDPAPDKELETLERTATGRIADYRGQWVLINFWASWCEPCRSEAPALQAFHGENRTHGFTVLGINLDDARDDAAAFVSEFGLTYPQLRDGDGRDRRDAYGMTGFPESFLIDPQGRIALIRRGPVDADYLSREVAPLIAADQSVR